MVERNCPHLSVWNIIKIVFLGSIGIATKVMSSDVKCTENQYTMKGVNGSTRCVDCPPCPESLGLSVVCGAVINSNTIIECVSCIEGFNFSTSNNREQCEPCSSCYDQVVTKKCTVTKDIECGKKCKSGGNYYDSSPELEDCQPCTWCCGDEKDIVEQECLDKGMSKERSCNMLGKKRCSPVGTVKSKIHIPTHSSAVNTLHFSVKTVIKPTFSSTHILDVTKQSPSDLQHKTTNQPTALFVTASCISGLVISMIIAYIWLRKRRTDCSISRRRQPLFFNTLRNAEEVQEWLPMHQMDNDHYGRTEVGLATAVANPHSHLSDRRQNDVKRRNKEEAERLLHLHVAKESATCANPSSPSIDVRQGTSSQEGSSGAESERPLIAIMATARERTNDCEGDSIRGGSERVGLQNPNQGPRITLSILLRTENWKSCEEICDLLEVDYSYQKLAAHYKMENVKIKLLRQNRQKQSEESPTRNVFEFINCSCDSGLTLMDLANVVEKSVERKDVACLLRKFAQLTVKQNQ